VLNKIGPNEKISERHFLVKRVEKRPTKNGDEYHILELSDNSGIIEARIWSNALVNCTFEEGKIIEVDGKSQEYRGTVSLIIDGCRIVNSEEAESYKAKIPTLVFDIETVGKDFEELNEKEQKYLLENLEADEKDREKAKTKTALYSIFGMVCAIGCYNPDSSKGIVLAISDKEIKSVIDNFEYKIFENESELLKAFWEIIKKYEIFVSYNGETFDFPYLLIRSGINRIRVPIEIKRFGENFVDLMFKIRQNHSFKLEFLCTAFGIDNPKVDGIHGGDVGELFRDKKFQEIADYVAKDAKATGELYQIWKEYMSGKY
jgi:DNA polymerase elongation subunit (family B)